eukprot:scaffold83286_cov68-Phaeocystis_antarctica.AAC.5
MVVRASHAPAVRFPICWAGARVQAPRLQGVCRENRVDDNHSMIARALAHQRGDLLVGVRRRHARLPRVRHRQARVAVLVAVRGEHRPDGLAAVGKERLIVVDGPLLVLLAAVCLCRRIEKAPKRAAPMPRSWIDRPRASPELDALKHSVARLGEAGNVDVGRPAPQQRVQRAHCARAGAHNCCEPEQLSSTTFFKGGSLRDTEGSIKHQTYQGLRRLIYSRRTPCMDARGHRTALTPQPYFR